MRSIALLTFGLILMVSGVGSRGECRTNVPFADAIQFDDGPLSAPSARFPYVAYSLTAQYASFFDHTVSAVMTDECAKEAFSKQISQSYKSTRSMASVSASGGKADFRFRAQGTLGQQEASANAANLGAGGKFRFRDVLTLEDAGTDPVNIEVIISMDGNVSLPLAAIPLPEQQGNSTVRLKLQDLTFCQGGGPLISISRQAQIHGPDYSANYVVTVCPTAVLRLDVLVDLSSTVSRIGRVGSQVFFGGYTFVDYLQCVSGNSVCFEDCEDPSSENCSGFRIRMRVLDGSGSVQSFGTQAQTKPRLVSAAGFDYSAPLPAYQPSIRVRQTAENTVVEWPSTANDWKLAGSADLAAWTTITNQPGFDPEEMMYQLPWTGGNPQQFFRFQKP